jgi:hypothetical protein
MDKTKFDQITMTTKTEIAKAIIATMSELKSIDKTKEVGMGRNAYKGVEDKEVKQIVRQAMIKNGLSLLPISVEAKSSTERWMETYNGETKAKQSVFTEVRTKYLLLHTSGESIELEGYGHGQDTQDKSAGKATTYAMKNLLLYMFLIPTGAIDDTDSVHSDAAPVRPATRPAPPSGNYSDDDKPWLTDKHERWEKAVTYVQANGPDSVQKAIATLAKDFKINKELRAALLMVSQGQFKVKP